MLIDVAPNSILQSRDNFKGCIRNIIVDAEMKSWTQMDDLHNVLLSECLTVS